MSDLEMQSFKLNRGSYSLILYLQIPKRISVGRLGEIDFPEGYYIYTGRASRALAARLDRHLRKQKPLRWHIDYLTCDPDVRVEKIWIYAGPEAECTINQHWQRDAGMSVFASGFGASDCQEGCGSHLVYYSQKSFFNLEYPQNK